MRFTPKYNVVYRGVFHQGGKAFDIAAEDAEKMRKHGTVEAAVPEQPSVPEPEQPAKKSTRAKKNE